MKKLLPILFILLLMSAAYPKTVNLSDYATPSDGLDDSAGLQKAVNDITATGGTVFVPGGVWDFTGMVYLNNSANISYKFKGDKGAVLRLNLGQSKRLFYAGNLNQLEFEDLIFVGIPTNIYDVEYIATVSYTQQFSIRNCQFFGIRAKKSYFYTTNTDAVYDTVQFEGGIGHDAVIHAYAYRGLTVKNTIFLDYGNFAGAYYSKLWLGNETWIKAEGVNPLSIANDQQRVKISDVRFDEGANTAINIKNASFVDISGIMVNLPDTSASTGIILDSVDYAEISMSAFGYATYIRPAVTVRNNTTFKAKALKFGGGVFFADLDETSEVLTESCADCLK